MKVYPVYSHDYSGDEAINVFTAPQKANDFVKLDMQEVKEILYEDGYEVRELYHVDYFEIYVPDSGIYYEWSIFEGELK